MKIEIREPIPGQEEELANIRIEAMKESLILAGRFDEDRARKRLLDSYDPRKTKVVYLTNRIIGFFVITENSDFIFLDHLYLASDFQNKGFGEEILSMIKEYAHNIGLPLRLNTLKVSKANDFYLKNGFKKIGEEEFDNIYEFKK